MSRSTYRKKGMVTRACTERKQKNKARLIIVIYEKSYHRNLHEDGGKCICDVKFLHSVFFFMYPQMSIKQLIPTKQTRKD